MRRLLASHGGIPVAAAVALTAGLAPFTDFGGGERLPFLIAIVVFIAIGELLEVTLPWGGTVTMGAAPAIGFMLAMDCDHVRAAASSCALTGNGPAEVAVAFAIGGTLALFVRALLKRGLRLQNFAMQSLTVVAASGVYAALSQLDARDAFGPPNISYLGIIGVFIVTILCDALLPAFAGVVGERLRLLPLLRSRLRASAALQMALVSVGSLLALAHPALDKNFPWSFLLILVPLAATQYSFRQFSSIQKTYLQTVGALAKVPEMAGYTPPGHSRRVADLAVDIALELGIEGRKIEEVQYAALLHDIGRVSLPDPESANDTTYRLQVALEGAAIVKETGYMPGVANIIGQQHEPYRRRGENQNRELDMGAKIVKVASAYDDLVNPGGPTRSPWDALERMHLGMAYEYDPGVIQAMTRVLEKRGVL